MKHRFANFKALKVSGVVMVGQEGNVPVGGSAALLISGGFLHQTELDP